MSSSIPRRIAATQFGAAGKGTSRRLRSLFGCWGLAGALVFVAAHGSASAQNSAKLLESKPIVHRVQGPNETMELTVNTSRILTLDSKIPKAQVNNPEILELTPLSATQIQILAKKPGVTQVNLWDENDQIHSLDVIVFADTQELNILYKQLFPKAALKVIPLPNSVMVSGYVDDPNIVSKIIAIAQEYHPKVLNNITVGGVQQVLLQVKVFEVSRTKLRQLGFDWGNLTRRGDIAAQGVGGLLQSANGGGTAPKGLTAGTGMAANAMSGVGSGASVVPTFNFGVVSPGDSFFGVLAMLQSRNVAKILAEPQLTTVSGRPAFFNAGGEFPILVPQSLGTLSTQYKKYGTQVDFVPIVLGNGAIRLEVRPRISELDPTHGITLNGTTVPALTTREIDTGAEMQAGQTLALAGLVQQRSNDVVTGIPWLSDLPVVGALFRKVSEQVDETELLIMVTPQLVEAMSPEQTPTNFPGMASTLPTDKQFYGKGHVEVPNCDPTGQLLGPYPGGGPFGVPGPGAGGDMSVPRGAMPAEGLPPGAREIPAPVEGQPADAGDGAALEPQPQDQSRRRTLRTPGAVHVTDMPASEASRSSRRRSAPSESIQRLPNTTRPSAKSPAAAMRPNLQKTSSRNRKVPSAAGERQKTAPGFIGPTGYDLR
ncbi:MAG TPA: pilus assembly protein N-terminal domain-containing protein [Pirellulales bacterium]|nr:pilus assembly protein N-terminal domain-containing protein [Pirellulales bacterium]